MPELPEVETVRSCLEPILRGARLIEVDVRHPRMSRRQPNPADIEARLRNRTVTEVGRHGKFLELAIDGGDFIWVMHLGMSGRISIAEPGSAEDPHTHVVVRHDGGPELRFVDPRTFGFVAVFTPEELAASSLARLGPDALTALPTRRRLEAGLADRRAPIKALLLDQRIVAGLGNIYADEVLHRAGVHGHRAGGSLSSDEVGRIRSAVRPVLRAGIEHGGTSLDDLAYLLPDGRAGEYLTRLRVYGREGEPCRRCGTPIERDTIAQRSSYSCPRCQT